MSAQIIPFPRRRPLDAHALPESWPEWLRGLYVSHTENGYWSHDKTFAYCKAVADVIRQPGESDMAFLSRQVEASSRFQERAAENATQGI